ncbi:uncharacterized protein [Triticum aestivum]|uniref:uncharacterized protein n=1 Tax=Triticum aestivum TaxID=4565 RepID=UPI001D026891|nr:uncharacterized protein LOC123038213 [Triticum aestivum]
MLVFVSAIVTVPKTNKLRAVVDMFICVSSVSYYMFTTLVISPEAKSIFSEIGGSLEGEGNRLLKALCSMMEEVRTFIVDDDSWAVEILQGRGEVHRNTRLMVDCIMSMKMTRTSARRHSSANLRGLVDNSVDYLKDVLLRKSELCPDLSMRYLFLLNNSYFIVQVSEASDMVNRQIRGWTYLSLLYAHISFVLKLQATLTIHAADTAPAYKNEQLLALQHQRATSLTCTCFCSTIPISQSRSLSYGDTTRDLNLHLNVRKHMDSYLDASWGHVLSCISKSKFPEPLYRWINTSSLAKFESAFHQTYQARKLWKVPDSRLRDVLRKAITKRVISGYGKYLKEHPRLEKHVGRESSSPEVLEEMLGELFEGWNLLEASKKSPANKRVGWTCISLSYLENFLSF